MLHKSFPLETPNIFAKCLKPALNISRKDWQVHVCEHV